MGARQSTFQAIGTEWSIDIHSTLSSDDWTHLLQEVHTQIELFDASFSRFRSDSWVTALSQQAGEYELPPDGYELLHFYDRLYQLTRGRVTPLIGQVLADAGYDAAYSFQKKPLHQPPRWEDVLTYDTHHLTLSQPVLLDFGAAGKGYLVDIISQLFVQAGVAAYVINAGGDLLHRAHQPDSLTVGLENPLDTSEAIGTVQLTNQSLCASAGSKRSWHGFHHIIDPLELMSPTDIIASWVVAQDTLTADGLATALFFVEPKVLANQFTFSYAVMGADMSLQYDAGFPVTIFEADAS